VQSNLITFIHHRPVSFVVLFAALFLAIDVGAGLTFMPERLEWQTLVIAPLGGAFWAAIIVVVVRKVSTR
jgi:hypothetical protein